MNAKCDKCSHMWNWKCDDMYVTIDEDDCFIIAMRCPQCGDIKSAYSVGELVELIHPEKVDYKLEHPSTIKYSWD